MNVIRIILRIIGYGILMSGIVLYDVLFKILYEVIKPITTLPAWNLSDIIMAIIPIANYALSIGLVGLGVIHLLWKTMIMEDMWSILNIYKIGVMLSTSGYLYLFGIGEIARLFCMASLLLLGFHGICGLYSFIRFMLITPQKTHCCL